VRGGIGSGIRWNIVNDSMDTGTLTLENYISIKNLNLQYLIHYQQGSPLLFLLQCQIGIGLIVLFAIGASL
jgi:hypothetical protein